MLFMFQFRNGSIKSSLVTTIVGSPDGFQFRNGSIKRRDSHLEMQSYSGFNSEMVRLKASRTNALFAGVDVSIPKWFD